MNDPQAPTLDPAPDPPPMPAAEPRKPAPTALPADAPTQPRPTDAVSRKQWKEDRARVLGDLPPK